MAGILVDTDVFIDHLRGQRRLAAGNNVLHYSVITRAELLAGTSATDQIDRLLAAFREHPVDRSVAVAAGRIRRESGIRLPDALIAATALVHKLGLATRNRRDFVRVRGLRLRAMG